MKRKAKETEGLKMLKEAFKVFDYNGDGKISTDFMKMSILQAGGCSMKEVDQMMEVLDMDRDGMVNLEDFHRIFIPHSHANTQNHPTDSWCCIM